MSIDNENIENQYNQLKKINLSLTENNYLLQKELEELRKKYEKDKCTCGWDEGGSGMFKGGEY